MEILDNIEKIYFVGIGGIGMSALAQFFLVANKEVYGYDQTKSDLTQKLKEGGAQISHQDDVGEIPKAFEKSGEGKLVIYTPAIPKESVILSYFLDRDFAVKKRAEVLGEISHELPTLAIAGTHGKTTTSAILAHLLKETGFSITAFMGGIVENFDSNFLGEGTEACVVEADEYDRSFLQLQPQFAGITAIEEDHMDVYDHPSDLLNSFHDFMHKLPSTENLFYIKGLDLTGNSVGVDEEADYDVQNVRGDKGIFYFDFQTPDLKIQELQLQLPGRFNLKNAALALAMALAFGADSTKLKEALKTFKGVDRRFSYRLKTRELVLIEDYAHHPNEIKAVYEAVRELYPDKKLTVVFQPHLYSRTKDFAQEFGESLSGFDEIMLTPIYPARETPIPGIDAEYLLGFVKADQKQVVTVEELPQVIKASKPEIVLVLGAGDIGKVIKPLKEVLL